VGGLSLKEKEIKVGQHYRTEMWGGTEKMAIEKRGFALGAKNQNV